MNASDFGTQLHTYYVLVAYIRVHGYPQTIAELAHERGVSENTIYEHLRQLEQRGLITRTRGWRNIRIERAA